MSGKSGREAVEVGLFGGNIFGIEPSVLETIFADFSPYRERISSFRISTKPVPLRNEIIRILKDNGVKLIELGMPSFNDEILQKLNRRHTIDEFIASYYALKNEGFDLAIQVMAGLPEEKWSDIKTTSDSIIQLNPGHIRIYPLAVIRGTPLENMYESGEFIPVSFEEALCRTAYIYLNALKHNIKTIKIGLTDNEIVKDKIVAGHYHPAFGYLVKSLAFYLAVRAVIKRRGIEGDITVHLNSRDIPHLIGHKRSNIERFGESSINISWQKEEAEDGSFIIENGNIRLNGSVFDAIDALDRQWSAAGPSFT